MTFTFGRGRQPRARTPTSSRFELRHCWSEQSTGVAEELYLIEAHRELMQNSTCEGSLIGYGGYLGLPEGGLSPCPRVAHSPIVSMHLTACARDGSSRRQMARRRNRDLSWKVFIALVKMMGHSA